MPRSSRHLIAVASLATLAALQSAPAAAQALPLIGQIMCAGYDFAPRDWVKLDGQLLPIAENQTLFALIGTTYGGDGQNTFAVPDMRGRTMIHRRQSPGTSNYQLGQSGGGGEYRTLTTLNLPPHSHQVLPLGSSSRKGCCIQSSDNALRGGNEHCWHAIKQHEFGWFWNIN